MSRMLMTREIAHAASRDAGDRHMRAAGRAKWNEDDWNAAVEEYDRLWPLERDLPKIEGVTAG